MTSGLPPDTAERRRAGVLVPVAVPFGDWLPFFAVLLDTVLLSVVRGCGRRTRLRCAPRRATVSHRPDATPGGDPSWACRHPQKRKREPAVPTSDDEPSGLSVFAVHLPATTCPIA